MRTIAKERLQEIAEDGFLKHGEAKAMARQLLASMEQEPVYQVLNSGGWRDVSEEVFEALKAEGLTTRALYAAPQLPQPAVPEHLAAVATLESKGYTWHGGQFWKPPLGKAPAYITGEQPVVPEAISTRQAISKMEDCEPCDSINVAYKYGWNACRAAMLQGAEPVSQPCTLRDGRVAVPVDMTPEQMRAVQRDSSLGTFASAHLSGAYDMYREFWDVAIAAAPQQEVKP